MLANGAAAARHISSNEEVHHYVAGPAERMDKLVGDYRMYSSQGSDKWASWIARITRSNSKNGQIFNHDETIEYLEQLRVYRPHYTVDSIYSIAFCIKNLHGTFGGVSDLFYLLCSILIKVQIFVSTVRYGLNVLQGIFGEEGLEISEMKRLEEYREAVEEDVGGTTMKKFKNVVARTWNRILMGEGNGEEKEVGVDLLTSQLTHLDDIFMTHFGKQARLFMTTSSSWTSIMPTYIEALVKHGDDLAQQPGQGDTLTTICDGLSEKMAWVMMDHGLLHFAPVMPLMTRSTVAMVAESLRDVGLAIYEVS